jgi:hypothetical protein
LSGLCEKGLKPKCDNVSDFTVENVRNAFNLLRGRRTAGKIVIEIK